MKMLPLLGRAARLLLLPILAVGTAVQVQAAALGSRLYQYDIQVGGPQSAASAVLFDGQFIWVAVDQKPLSQLEKFNLNGVLLSSTTVGVAPIELAYDGTNVWVTNYDSSSLSVVNPGGELIKTIFLPVTARPEGILFDGEYMWVANNGVGANSVTKVDAATMRVVASYPVGLSPDDLAFDGTYIWVTNSLSDNVMKLDRATGAILRTYPTGDFPLSILFDGSDMWIGNGAPVSSETAALAAGSLTELRAAGGVYLGTFASGNGVRGLAFDGVAIWACNSIGNTFSRIRAADGTAMGTYPTGAAPRSLAFDGVHMWIANSSANTVTVVTPSPQAIVVSPAVGYYIPAVMINPLLLQPIAGSVAAFDGSSVSSGKHASAGAIMVGILDGLLDND